MKNLMLWILLFIPALLVEVVCYALNPIVCLFVRKEPRTDRVKRIDNKQHTFDREYLIKPLMWFQTHDNALDEYWWGLFTVYSIFPAVKNATQQDYDSKWWLRYLCRVLWLYRNNAYGFLYNLFSRPVEEDLKVYTRGTKKKTFWYELAIRKSSWQFETHIPVPLTKKYMSINIGWKAHKGFPKMMYANRIIGPIRDFER